MKLSRFLLIAVVVAIFAGMSFAQTAAGMGGLSGTVRDASGASVPGAQVVVVNADKGIRRTLETNEAGIFTAPALVPAPGYQVTVNKPGFGAFEAKDLEILVGQQVDLSVTLQVAATTTQVEVLAETPLVDTTKTNVSQVVESAQIQDLPINGRRVDTFVLLTPGVTNDATYGLLSFRGIAAGNSFLVDGNDTTEQFYNENAGRTRIHSQLSQDAVQEFQVVSSGASAEYGRALGGVVNTVTKSGTNTMHGGAYFLFRNQDFDARDRYATFNPPETRYTAGATLGGAIKKDKLFYFFNTDITRRNFPIAGSLLYPGTVDPNTEQFVLGGTSGCGSAVNGKTPTAAQCAAINSILPNYFGQIPRQANQELAFGKIDWRPSERNSFSASFNFLHFVSPNGIQTSASITTGSSLSSNGDDSVRVRNARVSWTGIATPSVVNEVHFSWFTDRQADDFDPAELLPGVGYLNLAVGSISNLGATYYLPRVEPSETRLEGADNLTWTKGKHTFKFGMDIANSRDYTYYITDAFGYYKYSSVSAFALDFSGNTTGAKNWSSYEQGFGNPVVDATIRDNGFYAQDQYRITPKLTLNYGLRYEYAVLPQPPITNPDYPQTGHINSPTLNLEPRIGLAYSLDRNKMVVRASYGMFHSRFPGSLIDDLFTNNGVYQLSATFSSTNSAQLAAGPVYPNILSTTPSSAVGASSIQFLAPNARTPYTEQGTLAVERQLASDLGLTVSYLWNRGLQLLTVRNLNLKNPSGSATYIIDNASGTAVGSFETPVWMTADKINTHYTNVWQDENDINSYYNALVVQLRRRFSHGLWANVSYTWAHQIDDGQGNATNSLYFSGAGAGTSSSPVTYNGDYKFDKGSGNLDQRHRFVLSFAEQPTFTHRAGNLYKYVVNNWMLNGLVTFASGRPETATIYTQDTPVSGMFSANTINGFNGNTRVPFWPVNSLYTPPMYRADLILGKKLPFSERYQASVRFEAYNVTNSIVDTSLQSEAFTEKGKILTPYSAYGVGNGSGGFPDGTNARRLQLALRFMF
jgi:hypothetical protein